MKIKNMLVTLLILSALLVLVSFVGTAYAAESVKAESVEVRSEVLAYYPEFGVYVYPNNWAALYYDVKNTVHTEELYLTDSEVGWDGSASFDEVKPLAPGHVGIVYVTEPAFQKFEYDWSILIKEENPDMPPMPQMMIQEVPGPAGFAVLGFFGEPYVALSDDQITGYLSNGYSFFVEGYDDYKANKIAPLVVNDDAKYTLKTDDSLELGNGYSLFIEQIDIKGNKVHLILMKDGQKLETSIVNAEASKDWILKTTVLGDKDRQVLRVHVESVFQGSKDALVTIDGLWLVDYLNAIEVKSDVDYGKWKATHISSESLVYIAEDVALSSNSVIPLGKDWNIRVQDGFEVPNEISRGAEPKLNNRFYLFKEYTEPGKYDIRSSISDSANILQHVEPPRDPDFVIIPNPYVPGPSRINGLITPAFADVIARDSASQNLPLPDGVYTSYNFAAFYYDIDADLSTELLIAVPQSNYGGSQSFLKESPSFMYLTTTAHTDYDYVPEAGMDEDDNLINSWDSGYDIMGYFGEKYVPLNVVDADGFHIHDRSKLEKFSPLVTDDDTKYTLKTGDSLELGNGYSLSVTQIDLKGNKADLALYKDNALVTSSIVATSSSGGSGNWIYKDTVLNVKDVQLMRVHVKDVFNGGKTNLVEIDAVWLTDFKNVTELNADDEIGLLKYAGLVPLSHAVPSRMRLSELRLSEPESLLVFYLKNNLTMTDEMDVVIANSMSLKAYEFESAPDLFSIPPIGPRVMYGDTNSFKYYFYVTKEIGNFSSGNDDGDGSDNGGGNDSNESGDGSNKGSETDSPENEVNPYNLIDGVGAGAIAFWLFLLVVLVLAIYLYRRYKVSQAQK
ncbi:S-layer protein domain-containing protein [Methanimicrococcus blatticola]|uniref:S-layer protein (TIGR01567 family) n=1 Tax=Methanimicrococcus blatticola TaxID=91560 RepID=A0A484F4S4_9EURY|nr:S-layer protein domain-containing protein [Methanimicrococcus blatticola]MBZ3935859.1 hypothetical protein [Methanimicrococcus blatticola]MCC2508020.1 hypothetical protein [Methanimicrococcus blatticola]TDQ68897.1 S-layer protein (TIGR01567 family) [Methanimicrococcus blatticola]